MGHSGSKMVTDWSNINLGLMLKTPERLAMQNSVPVSLEFCPYGALLFFLEPSGFRTFSSQWGKPFVFFPFGSFPD